QHLAHGLNKLSFMRSRFDCPLAAPTFRDLCLSVQPVSIGLPDHDTAFHQALTSPSHHKVVKAADVATGVFDLLEQATGRFVLHRRSCVSPTLMGA
ncbi:hypothetical protein ACV36C_39000, partial [Pseudomonas aeruginosa]